MSSSSALEQLEKGLAEDLSQHNDPEVKGFAWMALLAALLPILLEQLTGCLERSPSEDVAAALSVNSFGNRLAVARILRRGLQESGSTMGFIQRAAFMTAAQKRFSDPETNQLILDDAVANKEWSLI